MYRKSTENLKVTGFTDSDWGSSPDRHSISGYVFKLNTESALISWRSNKQRIVALSTCEAEYIAITEASKEALFLRQLYKDVSGNKKDSVRLFTDNQGAIALAKNPVHHKRTKHIDIRYHFIRSLVLNGIIILSYIPSAENIADLFTKPLPRPKFVEFDSIRGPRFWGGEEQYTKWNVNRIIKIDDLYLRGPVKYLNTSHIFVIPIYIDR